MKAAVLPMTKDSIVEAARIVKEGGLVVYPTDTVYGLGCDPKNEKAVERLFEAKSREKKPIPVLCENLAAATRLVEFDPVSLNLARKYWPGALTIVAPMKAVLPQLVHQGTGAVGVRVPGLGDCLELIKLCGGYLAGTSANRSGVSSSRTAEEAFEQLGSKVDLILDGGRLTGRESTVVRVVNGKIEVLREGAVGVKDELG